MLGKTEEFFRAKHRRRKGDTIPRGFRDVKAIEVNTSWLLPGMRTVLVSVARGWHSIFWRWPRARVGQGRASKSLKDHLQGQRIPAAQGGYTERIKQETNANKKKTTLRTHSDKRMFLRLEI